MSLDGELCAGAGDSALYSVTHSNFRTITVGSGPAKVQTRSKREGANSKSIGTEARTLYVLARDFGEAVRG